ncbi:hypothetical protein CERSUDRAFT_100947 [Gelatoporia subvermispora B]|uniref:NACHT domain-containing protein n=1 Tax=Ceriporiopsis subvermispora (strain B) TaxID=914234 RepID=M2QWD6_CERS8|nr:hypothetical protein CERSUDRAFT_100947 [Gelatoporia subvermispora B]
MSHRISQFLERAKLKATSPRALSAERNGWLVLKKVLDDIAEAADMCPPLKTVLKGVVAVMEHVDTVKDVKDGFSKIASRLEGFQTIFEQYRSQMIPPVIRMRLKRLSEELVPIGTTIREKMGQGVTKRAFKALKDVEDVKDIFETLATLLEKYQIECNLSIELNVLDSVAERLLEKLGHVKDAGIDSQTGDACMEATRVELLNEIDIWNGDPDVARIFWLSGMAGTGKSAIARSVCHGLRKRKDNLLGASFFCSRGVRDDVKRIIPTLAESLSRHHVAYRLALLDILRDEPDIGHYTIPIQVERLLEKPLSHAFVEGQPMLTLVVDALDECSDTKAVQSLLSALVPRSRGIPIKFFLTSRPEPHIQSHFKSTQRDLHNTLRLHDIEHSVVEADIRFYCTKRLEDIRASHEAREPPYEFPAEWPSKQDIDTLTRQAGRLFIYAFTGMCYIEEERPMERLLRFTRLDVIPERPVTKPLDDMYSLVLANALDSNLRAQDEIQKTKQLLAIILVLRESLTVTALSQLIDMPAQDIRGLLGRLHAVVYTPVHNDRGNITTFHASFEDYLTSPARAPEAFRIDHSEGHEALATACIRIMASDALYFNVSGSRTSYLPNSQQTFALISTSLTYLCLHWVHHFIQVTDPSPLVASVYPVLHKKILFWLEVLSAKGHARLALGLLHRVLTAENIRDRLSPEMLEFLRDAKDFLMLGHDAIELSAPHIYLSVLPSLSPSSTIAKTFWPKFRNVLIYDVTGIHRSRGPLLQMSGHAGTVYSLAFLPDGTRVVSGSGDKAVRIWDARTGDLLMDPLEGHRDKVVSVAFSPDGAVVVSGSLDETIRIWNAKTGELMMDPLEGHGNGVLCVAFSPDGAQIVSGSKDHTLRLWDAKTGHPLLRAFEGHTGDVNTVMFSPDGRRVVSGSADSTIRIWDVMTGEEVMEPLRGHTGTVTSVAFSSDGTKIASGSEDITIRLWDARTGAPIIDPLVGHTESVFSVAFSPDGTRIVSGSSDKTVRLWDAATGRPVMQPFEGHSDAVWSVGFSPDGRTVVSGSGDKTIRLWSANAMDTMLSPDAASSGTEIHDGTLSLSSRLGVLVDDDDSSPGTNMKPRNIPSESPQGHGGTVVSGSEDKTVSLWNAQTGSPVLDPLQGNGHLVTCLAVSPDGSCIASGSADETIHLWDARTGRQVADPCSGHGGWMSSVVFSPDGTRLVSGSSDHTIRIWDVRTGRPVMEPLEGHSDAVWSVAISPNGTQIVSGSADNTLRLWNATTGDRLMRPLKRHSTQVLSVAFSPDGARIVSGSADATIRLWNARTGGAAMKPLRGHTNPVLSVSFSPDGEVIASGSMDTTVRLWNATTGVPVMKPLEGHSDAVHSVAFSPDGTRLVSGSDDNTIRIWDVTPGDSWLSSQGGHGSTIWSAIASSMRFPVALRPVHTLELDHTGTPHSSPTSQAGPEELPNPSYFCLESGWIKGPQDELIMWIPKDYWRGVLMPRTKVLIGRYRAMLDTTDEKEEL